MDKIEETFASLEKFKSKASVAQIGGFRPPEDRVTSWFGGPGVGLPGEELPQYQGKDMFCLMQVKVSELPYRPPELEGTEFLAVFMNRDEYTFYKPHGEGWLIREYETLDGLQPLPTSDEKEMIKSFPIQWRSCDDDMPDWCDVCEWENLTSLEDDEYAFEKYYETFNQYDRTKFGGYPNSIQHDIDPEEFVFQVGCEEKARWMWAGSGIAYFFKTTDRKWRMEIQSY